jgi:Hemolysin coregulated protein Hcp (TssD)
MAFPATLHIEGHPREHDGILLISCSFSFHQQIDQRGAINSRVTGGIIDIGLMNENDSEILQWMFSQNATKNGKIVFGSISENRALQTLKFKDAALIMYQQSYSNLNEVSVALKLSCREIDISGNTFQNIWQSDNR